MTICMKLTYNKRVPWRSIKTHYKLSTYRIMLNKHSHFISIRVRSDCHQFRFYRENSLIHNPIADVNAYNMNKYKKHDDSQYERFVLYDHGYVFSGFNLFSKVSIGFLDNDNRQKIKKKKKSILVILLFQRCLNFSAFFFSVQKLTPYCKDSKSTTVIRVSLDVPQQKRIF